MGDLDINQVPFDSATMAKGLRAWVEEESPTYDREAVNRMVELAARDMATMGASLQRIADRFGVGACLKAVFPHKRKDTPGILVLGHLDTVHPKGAIRWRQEGERCYGPGVLDMKAGNYLSLEAIKQLQRIGWETPLPITVLFTSDEEIGSPGSREIIEAEAARNRYVLIPEPARRDGGVVTGRHAIARFNMVTRGRSSHAGLQLEEGVSAIREMAHQILAIEAMTDDESGFSVGVVQGGKWVNCVPTACDAQVLVSGTSEAAIRAAEERMVTRGPINAGAEVEVTPGLMRPLWGPNDASTALYHHARALARQLGFDISAEISGGGSDGNFTGAMGIPTLDGLGARGDGMHTIDEHIVTESLAERAGLMAALFTSLEG